MKKILLFFLFPFLFLFGNEPAKQKSLVMTTLSPYQVFIKEIVKDKLDVLNVIPPDKNPHGFEPTIKDMEFLSRASVWFCMGEAFETKILATLKKHNPDLTVYDLCEDLSLVSADAECEHAHEHKHKNLKDRHVWLSPKQVIKQVLFIEKKLIQHFPEHKEFFKKETAALILKLGELSSRIEETLTSLHGKTLVASHPDFTYFCKDYGLDQLSIEKEGKDPSPRQLLSLFNELKEKEVKVIFFQPQYNDKGAKLLAEKIEVPLVYFDPFDTNYFTNLETLSKTLKEQYQPK